MSRVTRSLRMMQNMERFATEIYRAQTGDFREKDIADMLRAATANERQHADDLAARLKRLGSGPSPLGIFFQTAGALLGLTSTFVGKVTLFRVDTWVEKRAVRDYGRFLAKVDFDSETVDLLHRIVGDEERHVANWQSCIKRLKGKRVR